MMARFGKVLGWMVLLLAMAGRGLAENEGQGDLDKAMELKISATTAGDWGEVINACRKALTAGLDEPSTKFANQLLCSTLTQRAETYAGTILDRPAPSAQWTKLRQMALDDLEESLKIDEKQSAAWYLVARLELLPMGDADKGKQAIDKVIEFSGDDTQQKSKGVLLKAIVTEDAAKQIELLDESIKLNPKSDLAYRRRGALRLAAGKFEEAEADLREAVKMSPKNPEDHQSLGLALLALNKMEEGVEELDEAIRMQPDLVPAYVLRAQGYLALKDVRSAISNLEVALRLDPNYIPGLVLRSKLFLQGRERDRASKDLDQVLHLQPTNAEALILRSRMQVEAGKLLEGAETLEKLRAVAPKNVEILLEQGWIYLRAKLPEKSVEVYTAALTIDPASIIALRGRADAYLAIGKQSEAILDYEQALKKKEDDDAVLNNLAWVLSTSTKDDLRNGKRAVELATKACEVTEFKRPHILSTLAASYAELGDWDKAIEWSQKAVNSGEGIEKDQLAKELKSYHDHKPWRESQTPDYPDETPPPDSPDDLLKVNPDSLPVDPGI
jgi:tetratricopeptide (TPR) repeat protein